MRQNLKEWVESFKNGDFLASTFDVQVNAGWFDWFCKDSSLGRKTETLGKKLLSIVDSKKLDPENQYVFFKNNCPMCGDLYDSFSICDIETGDVKFWICPSLGHKNSPDYKKAVVNQAPDFETPVVVGTWRDVVKWFKQESE